MPQPLPLMILQLLTQGLAAMVGMEVKGQGVVTEQTPTGVACWPSV